jgi:hypothetical protein
MTSSRVTRGRRTQKAVAAWLRANGWPRAEAVEASVNGRDILHVPGHAIEVKARRDFRPAEWLKQARSNAGKDIPCVIVRLDGQGEDAGEYLVFRRLADDEISINSTSNLEGAGRKHPAKGKRDPAPSA